MELFLAMILASHRPSATGPYDWHIPCERWQTRAVEIWEDENLPLKDRKFLINYLRGKVEGNCPYPSWDENG